MGKKGVTIVDPGFDSPTKLQECPVQVQVTKSSGSTISFFIEMKDNRLTSSTGYSMQLNREVYEKIPANGIFADIQLCVLALIFKIAKIQINLGKIGDNGIKWSINSFKKPKWKMV